MRVYYTVECPPSHQSCGHQHRNYLSTLWCRVTKRLAGHSTRVGFRLTWDAAANSSASHDAGTARHLQDNRPRKPQGHGRRRKTPAEKD